MPLSHLELFIPSLLQFTPHSGNIWKHQVLPELLYQNLIKSKEERVCDPKVVRGNYLIPIQTDSLRLRINQARLISSSQIIYWASAIGLCGFHLFILLFNDIYWGPTTNYKVWYALNTNMNGQEEAKFKAIITVCFITGYRIRCYGHNYLGRSNQRRLYGGNQIGLSLEGQPGTYSIKYEKGRGNHSRSGEQQIQGMRGWRVVR